MIALLVITDGRRDYITRTIPSALANLEGPITRRVLYDDSGDPDHRDWLSNQFPTFELVTHPDGRQGFGGAIRAAWAHLADGLQPFVFHLEDDFTFNRPVDLVAMSRVLLHNDDIIQVALRRQPWNDEERAAGGIVEKDPDDFHEITTGSGPVLVHRRFFTTNPSLYRRSLCSQGWPTGANSEGMFTHQVIRQDSQAWFAFWGSRDSGEAVTHIGKERAGLGY